jgi:hypothetical protein
MQTVKMRDGLWEGKDDYVDHGGFLGQWSYPGWHNKGEHLLCIFHIHRMYKTRSEV